MTGWLGRQAELMGLKATVVAFWLQALQRVNLEESCKPTMEEMVHSLLLSRVVLVQILLSGVWLAGTKACFLISCGLLFS